MKFYIDTLTRILLLLLEKKLEKNLINYLFY